MLKSLAYEFGINPKIVLSGKKKPEVVQIWETCKMGNSEDVEFIGGRFLGKGRQRFEKLLEKSKMDKMPVSPEILAKYLSGTIEKNQNLKIKEMAKQGYNRAIYSLLMDDDYYTEIEKALPVLYDVYISPINYRRAPLKIENLIKKSSEEVINKNIESEEENDSEEQSGFGV